MTPEMPEDYYASQMTKLLKDFDGKAKRLAKTLALHQQGQPTDAILSETRQAFEQLVPDIPYIGGKDNPLTQDLVDCTTLLALYRVLKGRGLPIEEIGRIVIEIERQRVYAYPGFVRKLLGKLVHSSLAKNRLKRTAEQSQERRYPGGWVSVYVEGDGETFDSGIDYLECGLHKFRHQQGADELMPYFCQFDFVQQRAMGTGFFREATLAEGADRCTFRWKKGLATQAARPPHWLT
jgi:hypothetical protein